ncbi:MAG: hypothetical protein P4M09_17060 [Devosia sp.]|nr:hypothetical protein [Devosia sp.]
MRAVELEKLSANTESPSQEMQRLFRTIAGKASAGEKDEQLRSRALRRMNADLIGPRQLGPRRARAYWYGEIDDVPSHHMDRARELAFILPIEEAIDAVEVAEQFLSGLRESLLERVTRSPGASGGRGAAGDCDRRASDPRHLAITGHHRAPIMASALPALRRMLGSAP